MTGRGRLIAAGLALAAAAIPASLHARDGGTSSATGQAGAQVVKALQVVAQADLHFGAIVVGRNQGGEVIVGAADGAIVFVGAARSACGQRSDCTPHPALFSVSGEALRTYSIAIGGAVEARGATSGTTLEVSGLTVASENLGPAGWLGQLDALGLDSFTIGGTLHIPGGTRPDIFRADLPITVTYE